MLNHKFFTHERSCDRTKRRYKRYSIFIWVMVKERASNGCCKRLHNTHYVPLASASVTPTYHVHKVKPVTVSNLVNDRVTRSPSKRRRRNSPCEVGRRDRIGSDFMAKTQTKKYGLFLFWYLESSYS